MNADDIIAQIKSAKMKYYCYILLKENGLPFYVGKGTGLRAVRHERDAINTKENNYKLNIIRKLHRNGLSLNYLIDSFHIDSFSAVAREIELIEIYGRKDLNTGILINKTSGGEGVMELSDESKKIKSEKAKGRKLSDDVKKKISLARVGIKFTEEHKNNLSKAKLGKTSPRKGCKLSDEVKEKLRISANSQWSSKDAREKASERGRKQTHMNTDEYRMKMSIAQKEAWQKRKRAVNV